jgi:hypothetical protein
MLLQVSNPAFVRFSMLVPLLIHTLPRCLIWMCKPHRGILSKLLSVTESSRTSADPAASVLVLAETGSRPFPSDITAPSSGARLTPFCLSFAVNGLAGAASATQNFRSASRITASRRAVGTSSCLFAGIRSRDAGVSVAGVAAGGFAAVFGSGADRSLGSSAFGSP